MAIQVDCKCGKRFKVKDQLAGKAVRCPACGSPLRIPGAVVAKSAVGGPAAKDTPDADAALLRYEEAQKKKQMSAEEEAAYREEQNKLIASYDHLSGKGGQEKKKKTELAGTTVKKRTVIDKIADVFGAMKGNLLFKYSLIVAILGGAAVGSVYLVEYVTGYMHHESAPPKPKEERIRDLFKEAGACLDAKDLVGAERCLNDILKLDPSKEVHRDFRALRERLQKGG